MRIMYEYSVQRLLIQWVCTHHGYLVHTNGDQGTLEFNMSQPGECHCITTYRTPFDTAVHDMTMSHINNYNNPKK